MGAWEAKADASDAMGEVWEGQKFMGVTPWEAWEVKVDRSDAMSDVWGAKRLMGVIEQMGAWETKADASDAFGRHREQGPCE